MSKPISSPLDLSKAYPLPKVKELTGVTPTKKKYQIELQGLMLFALQDYAKKKKITESQAIRDILEFRLVKDGWLPNWWYTRRFQ